MSHLERFRGGCWAMHDGELGICLKSFPSTYLDVKGEYLMGGDACVYFSGNTFIPVRMSEFCSQVIEGLLGIAEVSEELSRRETVSSSDAYCQDMRTLLNQRYDQFVRRFGLLNNYKKWIHGKRAIWADYRLLSYAFPLETQQGQKATIFFQRVNYPPTIPVGQLFFQDDEGDRVESAYYWTLRHFDAVDLDQISEKSGIPPSECEGILRYRGLVMRWVLEQEEEAVTVDM